MRNIEQRKENGLYFNELVRIISFLFLSEQETIHTYTVRISTFWAIFKLPFPIQKDRCRKRNLNTDASNVTLRHSEVL